MKAKAGDVFCGFLCALAPWREPDRLQKEVSRRDAETQSAAKSEQESGSDRIMNST